MVNSLDKRAYTKEEQEIYNLAYHRGINRGRADGRADVIDECVNRLNIYKTDTLCIRDIETIDMCIMFLEQLKKRKRTIDLQVRDLTKAPNEDGHIDSIALTNPPMGRSKGFYRTVKGDKLMTKTFCDICGKSTSTSFLSEALGREGKKVKVKIYESWFDVKGWQKLDVCPYCCDAIVLKSNELRAAEGIEDEK